MARLRCSRSDAERVRASQRPLLGIGPTNDARLAFFAVQEGILVIGIISPAGQMADAAEMVRPIIHSIWIEEET